MVKADATGNGRREQACGGERWEKAPWSGSLRSPADEWELGGTQGGSGGFWEPGPLWREGLEVGLGANLLQIEGFLFFLQMFT